MSRAPLLWQKLDAKDSTESVLKRRAERAEIRRERWRTEGWSEEAVYAGFEGIIWTHEYNDDRIEMGLPEKMSDRKSKRKREKPKRVPSFWARYLEA